MSIFDLTIAIPTFNKSKNIERTLLSIRNATIPRGVDLTVLIVDNNSKHTESAAYRELVSKYSDFFRLEYALERKQGRSHALNHALSISKSEFIGFIDDDEEIHPEWISAVHENFAFSKVEYICGPCLPSWEVSPPPWLPARVDRYRGLLGWIEQSDIRIGFNEFDGELCGGNCAFRTDILLELGGFNTMLGRSSNNLLGGEDGELHRRLMRHKRIGIYDPKLIIFHQIPKFRMTFRYHIRWAYWSGVSNGIRIAANPEQTENTAHLFGIPRYWYKKALFGAKDVLIQSAFAKLTSKPKGICGLMDVFYFFGLAHARIKFREKFSTGS